MNLRNLPLVPKQKGSWLVTFPLIAIALIYLVAWFVPTRKSIAELRVALDSAENLVVSYGQSATQLEPAERRLAATRAYVDEWSARLIDETEIPSAFAVVSDAATAAGVKTARFAPNPPEPSGMLSRVVIDLQVVGTFGQIGEFLGRLEQLDLISWVDAVEIATDRKNSEELSCGLSIVVFVGREEISG